MYPIYQTRNQGRREFHPMKNFRPLEKYFAHRLKVLDIVQKFVPLSENSSPLLRSQVGYGPAIYWQIPHLIAPMYVRTLT